MIQSPAQREKIAANCLPSSWQALAPVLQRVHCPPSARPEIVVDWLSSSKHRSQTQAGQLLLAMEQRIWRIETRPEAPTARAAQGSPTGSPPLSAQLRLDVRCGSQRWTLWLSRQPQLGIERITA